MKLKAMKLRVVFRSTLKRRRYSQCYLLAPPVSNDLAYEMETLLTDLNELKLSQKSRK